MAIVSAKGRKTGHKSQSNGSKANAIGYAKRHSRKGKLVSGLSDVYDHSQQKTRRANISLSLDKDERDGGRGSDEDEEEDNGRVRPRLIGEDDGADALGSDEDEEIESDDAFEEGDEVRFAGLRFSNQNNSAKGRKKKTRTVSGPSKNSDHANVDLNEEEEEEESRSSDEEGDSDEFVDVLDVLDGKGEYGIQDDDDAASTTQASEPSTKGSRQHLEDDDDDDSSDEQDAEEDLAISGSEDEIDDSALQTLRTYVSGLETGTKRKADEDSDKKLEPKKKKKMLPQRTEGGAEGEFGAGPSESTKLTLDDLIAPTTMQSSTLNALKKSIRPLAASANPKKGPLPAPLPQRHQDRLDREGAYEQTKTEADKWDDTINRIKYAEHLSFPLQKQSIGRTSTLELTAKFKPTTLLERSIDKLLKKGELREEDITKTEALKMNDLSVEEVAERRARLRKMRELMFREEAKAKRVAKIKSKVYRKIHRREKEKLGEEGSNMENKEDEQVRMEVERAKERATLRHKNKSKWARALKERGELDVDQRRDINEMLERGERLRRKIQGQDSDGQDGDSEDDDGDDDNVEEIRSRAFEELKRLNDLDEPLEQDGEENSKSVFAMKFMKEAAARQSREVNEMVDDFRKELGEVPVNSDDEFIADDNGDPNVVSVTRTSGRMTFRPGQTRLVTQGVATQSQLSDVSTLKSSDHHTSPVMDTARLNSPSGLSYIGDIATTPVVTSVSEPNPWLQRDDASSRRIVRKRNEIVIGKDSSSAIKSQNALQKQIKKTDEERQKEVDDAVVEIDSTNTLLLETSKVEKQSKKRRNRKAKVAENAHGQVNEGDDSDGNSEVEEQEKALQRPTKGLASFQQQGELVARAFAGDHVVQDFADAKRREIAADAPREKDTTLPGWGSWGGQGAKRQPPKPHLIKKIAGIDPKSRADYNKAHVIISEKKDKKAAKYTINNLPYPYTSQSQFERKMDMPLGTEWNTRVSFQRATLPRVVKKMGTVIDPVQRLF